jgi:flagellar basal-body rod protein FlgF
MRPVLGTPVAPLGRMNRGIYAAATAMAAAERRVETISSNLANAGAVGFKRKGVITHSFQNQMNKLMAPQVTTRESTDFSQGILRTTGGDFDLALEGEGFFAVDTAEGQVFTRNGAFHIDQDGVLQTRDGYPVAWEGSRGTIDPAGGSVSVDSGGNVWQGSNNVGRIRIVDFADSSKLHVDRHGNMRADADGIEQPATGIVRQGMLENANVNAIDEMVGLIAAQRSFESSARLISSIEQIMRRITSGR